MKTLLYYALAGLFALLSGVCFMLSADLFSVFRIALGSAGYILMLGAHIYANKAGGHDA